MYEPEAYTVDRVLYKDLIRTIRYKLNEMYEEGEYPPIAILRLESYIEKYDFKEEE